MLSGASRGALPRGIALLRRTHAVQPGADSYTHRRVLGLRARRYYGRILRSIISKHVSSIADVVRPVFPAAAAPPLPDQRPSHLGAKISSAERTDYSPRTTENAVELQDDAASETHDASVAETDIQDRVRHLMRQVPHPVAIITSTDPNSHARSAFRGMTVSSFNTVTLYPEPVVSFNVKIPSETYNAILSSSRFFVHLLTPNENTARLAREFSKGHENVSPDGQHTFFKFTSPSTRQNQNSPAIHSPEPPRLVIHQDDDTASSSNENFPFIFECRYRTNCRVGDHVLVLGTVVNVLQDEPCTTTGSDGDPQPPNDLCLTYANSRFWRVGEAVTPSSEP